MAHFLLVTTGPVLNGAEQAVADVLTTAAHTYDNIIDSDPEPADLSAYGAVLVLGSTADLGTKYGAIAEGMVSFSWGYSGVAGIDLHGGTSYASLTTCYIADDSHYAAAGLTGSVTWSSSSVGTRGANTLGAGATTVAQQASGDSDALVAVYEVGSALLNAHTAEGRRVYIGLVNFEVLTADGESLILAASEWAAGEDSGGAATLTVADATHAHTADAPTLTVAGTLAVADALHAHTADTPTLSTAITYHIGGTVTLDGVAVQGATVRLLNITAGTLEATDTTDATGAYDFPNLDEGALYHLAVEHEDAGTYYHDYSEPYVTPDAV